MLSERYGIIGTEKRIQKDREREREKGGEGRGGRRGTDRQRECSSVWQKHKCLR